MRRRSVIKATAYAAVGAVTTTTVAACQDDNVGARWTGPSPSADGGSPSTASGGPALTIMPANSENVSPGEPVVVTAESGTLQSVTVTIGTASVAGSLDPDQKVWRSTTALEYGKTYKVSAVGLGADGSTSHQETTFSTVKPSSTATVTFQANALTSLKDGGTYGVGQVVIARFSKTPSDRAAALNAISVSSAPSVEGRWYWVDSRTAHYRPQEYWAKGTQITVKTAMLGAHFGKGVYGLGNTKLSFRIGPARIAIADNKTHHMRITVDGVQVKDMPISMGKDGYVIAADGSKVLFPTRSGTHVVMSRELEHQMTSASYGVTDPHNPNYYDELIKLCCRISYSGEFVHSAPWSVGSQGRRNVSHGCINVGPSNAQWFYDNFRLGDVVIVKDTGRPQLIGDSAGAVWDIPWSKMTPAA